MFFLFVLFYFFNLVALMSVCINPRRFENAHLAFSYLFIPGSPWRPFPNFLGLVWVASLQVQSKHAFVTYLNKKVGKRIVQRESYAQ